MATITIEAGVVNDDIDLLMQVLDPMPPYKTGYGELAQEYIVGTDFTSGDTLVFTFKGSTKIRWFSFCKLDGTVLLATEADIGGGEVGRKLTLNTAPTYSFKARVCYEV